MFAPHASVAQGRRLDSPLADVYPPIMRPWRKGVHPCEDRGRNEQEHTRCFPWPSPLSLSNMLPVVTLLLAKACEACTGLVSFGQCACSVRSRVWGNGCGHLSGALAEPGPLHNPHRRRCEPDAKYHPGVSESISADYLLVCFCQVTWLIYSPFFPRTGVDECIFTGRRCLSILSVFRC